MSSRANLILVHELNDRAAEGRAYGNLGNTHYLLGNFEKAVQYHEEVNYTPKLCSVSFSLDKCGGDEVVVSSVG